MSQPRNPTILCLASYFKGNSFITAAKDAGAHVILLTREKVAGEAWPHQSIDELHTMPDLRRRPDIFYAVSYLTRSRAIDAVVPLDDYDVETAAALREHLRLPGLGDSAARLFRDKLAMRQAAQAAGIPVPPFTPVFSHRRLHAFMERVPPPWVLKPRSEAGAMGIKKVNEPGEVWHWLEQLGDEQSFFHLEKFVPGDVFHVDSLVYNRQIQFAQPHQYPRPPMNVAHEGGVFASRSLPTDSDEGQALLAANSKLLTAFNLEHGATHAEFIRAEDGTYYFLEVAARVGGANIEQLVEAASGLNLWGEWAKMEVALASGKPYTVGPTEDRHAGILVCLARQEHPDMSGYTDPEIVYRIEKRHHAGLVVASHSPERVAQLIDSYAGRFSEEFLAVLPPLDKPPV